MSLAYLPPSKLAAHSLWINVRNSHVRGFSCGSSGGGSRAGNWTFCSALCNDSAHLVKQRVARSLPACQDPAWDSADSAVVPFFKRRKLFLGIRSFHDDDQPFA